MNVCLHLQYNRTPGHVITHWSFNQSTFRAQDQFSSGIKAPDDEQTDGADGEAVQAMKERLTVNAEPEHDSALKSLLHFILSVI